VHICDVPFFALWLRIQMHAGLPFEPSTRTQDPIVTGAGIVACKFDNGSACVLSRGMLSDHFWAGVLIASDTLGSYGTLARFKDVTRVGSYGSHTIVGAAGDLSDFQVCKCAACNRYLFFLIYHIPGHQRSAQRSGN